MAVAAAAFAPPAARRTRARPSPYWLLLLPLVVPLVLLYLVPLGRVLWISFTDPAPGFANYERLMAFPALQRVLWTTLRVGATTTAIALTLGYLVAYVMTRSGPRHRLWLTAFVLVPFWVSLLVRAFAWLTLLRTEGVINQALTGAGLISQPLALVHNELGVVIGMVHYMIPYAVLPLYANMQGIDPRLGDASRSLGAGPLTTFLRIFLPLSMPGIAAAGVLVFIFSLGFYVTPALLGGGRVVMIAEYVSVQILQTVRWGVGTMMASVLLLSVVLLLLAISRIVDLRQLFGAR